MSEQERGRWDRLDAMPTEALEELLRLDSQLPEGEGLGADAVLRAAEVIARRESAGPGTVYPDVDQAWQRFLTKYYPCEPLALAEEAPGAPGMAPPPPPAPEGAVRPRRGRNVRWLTRAALAFTLLADLFLLVLGRWYPVGVACFCVVQLLYLTRIAGLRPEKLPLRLALRGLLTAAALLAVRQLGALDGLTALSLFYFSQLVCNALESLSLGASCRGFALGLFLFVGCDLCVGLQNLSAWFPAAGGPLVEFARIGMWLFYLPSQVLISLSVERK